jgi:hypothetical protein
MERENITHICVVQVFCSFNLFIYIYIVYSSDAKSPGFTGSLPVWNLTSRSPGERTKSPGIHVGPIVLSVINSENPKKYKRYKQLVLKSF